MLSRTSVLFWLLLALVGNAAAAIDASLIKQLGSEENDTKIEAIRKIAESGDVAAIALLQAMLDGELAVAGDGATLIVNSSGAIDAVSGKKIDPAPEDAQPVSINNRVRRAVGSVLAALKLSAPDRKVRLAAVKNLQANADENLLPTLERALAKEQDAEIKSIIALTQAEIHLKSKDPNARLSAVKALAESANPNTRSVLSVMLEKKSDGAFNEPDARVRAEAQGSLKAMERRLTRIEWLGHAFSGVSLGSILLLAALGLAITFGLMGIINMAHGELLMIGAYATYVTQNVFRRYFPDALDWYVIAAIPAAFIVAGLVGMALERGVIRFLYGRPLETLLCTWGISLILIQAVRAIFGAQNVEVANPSWMSGGITLASGLTMPYNRIMIIGFAAIVVLLVSALLNKTRLGLFVRAVTQNRTMADCVGVPTGRIDMWTFGLGSGIAGLGGVALSQVGNVGPELGQTYIVDSFMVVVLGGVGQLAGTVIAAMGLGEINKFLEPYAGAVLGKIFVLVLIIIFIQKRPQGLFALKGRSAEAMA
jgi:urea transport system permease protein